MGIDPLLATEHRALVICPGSLDWPGSRRQGLSRRGHRAPDAVPRQAGFHVAPVTTEDRKGVGLHGVDDNGVATAGDQPVAGDAVSSADQVLQRTGCGVELDVLHHPQLSPGVAE